MRMWRSGFPKVTRENQQGLEGNGLKSQNPGKNARGRSRSMISSGCIFLFLMMVAGSTSAWPADQPAKGKLRRGEPIAAPPDLSTTNPPSAIPATNSVVTNLADAARVVSTNIQTGDYLTVGFDKLSAFNCELVEVTAGSSTSETTNTFKLAQEVPSEIKALDNKKVAITGFMLPLKVRKGVCTEYLILQSQMMCCFGAAPRLNEWVQVRMNGEGVKSVMDVPVTVYGTLQVGEKRENGYLVGLYDMVGDRLVKSEGL
jgi:hypothetical protein